MEHIKKIQILIAALLGASIIACGTSGGSASGSRDSPGNWTFDTAASVGQWEAASGEFWQYTGSIKISHDTKAAGNGTMRIDLDFSAPGNQGDWSEPKIKTAVQPAFDLTGYNEVHFDFYYNPAYRTKGGFQAKIFGNGGLEANAPIPEEGEKLGNGFVKVQGVIKTVPSTAKIDGLTFSIIGSSTDYKGAVFIDNLRFASG